MLRLNRVGGVLLLLVVLVGAALVALATVTRPRTTGALQLRGLNGPVTVTRDRWGVPHIRASASDTDALYALGFVHAQDRLWQMEFQRRVAQGRLSEVLGEAALPQDKFLRTWGFYRAAQAALPTLNARTRALVSAYTAGVNAAIAQDRVPLEFRLLRFRPEPWTDVDSIAWQKLMAYDLGGNWDQELLGREVLEKLGPDRLNQVLPPYPKSGPTILSGQDLPRARTASDQGAALPQEALRELRGTLAAARALGFENAPGKGSNDWVLGPSRTTTGGPILADDPHLKLSAPMLWYLADVRGPDLHVIGATIPGLPGVVIGRNDRVAWGVTNVNPDVQDLYVEGASAKLTTRTEVIRVKGQDDVRLTVQESAHGPIISGVNDRAGHVGPRVALKWTALMGGDTTFDAFLGLNYARNWTDFTAALRAYVAPSQNFVYADVDGNIGYYAPGRIPIRRGWDGSLPVPGDGTHEWTGYIPFEALPHTFNPPEAQVVTANNKVVPDSFPYALANERLWSEPYRAARILEGLNAHPKLGVEDVQRVQQDTRSSVWRDLKPFLLATRPDGDASARALDLLRAWDGQERTDSAAPTVFEGWLLNLQNMAQDELGAGVRLNSLAVLNQLRARGPLCAEGGQGDCARLLTRTLAATVTALQGRLGQDPNGWTWGRVHVSRSDHGAFGGVQALAWLWNRSVSAPGGTNTVNVARPADASLAFTHAPSYRQVIDLAHPNRSVFIGTLGQSGNVFSEHYADQQALWARGAYLPMSTDPRDWGRTQTLTLTPGQ
ncbi:penicillin acylase family protein [Deinococcus maricopensis]|uniref:Peptidase S45 penicillin amidase n=1 Tax=Deinococcus maricopensis (strain DSM 21211 / LMG 22137 / NRRL B-23946 / LB-34) TaxID=709986 RepID=E8U4P4_DEIML|nr:penicillin acylase family protein [Deinococcus maricopensis]ADV68909.1 peptidase S45 penicillin amidase [Deinococcus maricopensis DSM 21211]